MVKRLISLNKKNSSLWFGPRQSGKSTLIRNELRTEPHWEVNLLESDTYRKYLVDPAQFRKDAEYQIGQNKIRFIFIDEIQKVPALLDEVHNLIEKYRVICVLSGSSARKLKRQGINLLGGRATLHHLFPLLVDELGTNFDLQTVLQHGTLVGIYFDPPELRVQKLRAYVDTYLKEEIAQEGLVRNLDIFQRFLDVAAAHATEIISYTNIATASATSLKTIKNYFSILYETLIGYELPAWHQSVRRQLSKHPKFYFVDNGITNAITKQLRDPPTLQQRGKWFEQWVINEIRAHASYSGSECSFYFWRTERGEFEVDLVITKKNQPIAAIEIKAKKKLVTTDFSGLRAFKTEYPECQLYCVCETSSPYQENSITVFPVLQFLSQRLKTIL